MIRISKQKSPKLAEYRLRAVLEEYKALKNELLQKFRHQLQMYSITITAVTVIVGFAFTEKNYDLLLVTPIVSSAFAFRYVWEQSIMSKIGDYLRIIEAEILPEIIGHKSNTNLETTEYWVGWEHYFMRFFPRPAYYILTIEILFIGPILLGLAFNVAVILQYFELISLQVRSSLLIKWHIALALGHVILAWYVSKKLWKG